MSRLRSEQPAYHYHASGQARVRLDSVDFYLGKHGTPESYARYYALLAEYNANSPTHRSRLLNLCQTLDAEYPAAEFGSRKLAEMRELFLVTTNRQGRNKTRRCINGQIRDIVKLFQYGVSRELVPIPLRASTWMAVFRTERLPLGLCQFLIGFEALRWRNLAQWDRMQVNNERGETRG